MTDNITVTQKSTIGSDTTQIANQNNYYGLTPEKASKLAIDLFMDNFPKLQEKAMETVKQRADELINQVVAKIQKEHEGNYTKFSEPDMQYILVEAEKGYARRGTTELCNILTSLLADRSACSNNSYLEIVLDKAIELAPLLQPAQLDYLSLTFIYKHVRFSSITSLEDIEVTYKRIHSHFQAPTNYQAISYFNMLGLLTLNIGNAAKTLSKTYGFQEKEIAQVLPAEHKIIPADYGLTPVGIVLAIFNAHSKSQLRFDIQTWIHE